ncbi:LysE family translocator [Comamonas kerstersii]|jgi:threonine/homoserine/homoserine lactone efflux protein|uniref:Lysine transporter LysE n=1 Tax=Comamonas kerstersii TaxID=225992 RepID=A0A0W7Z4S5_9BURK|nr:LysE family translocator [Comamonas kerstersii]MDO4968508.1 LysE family translocator [Comamonadaceae bacterium]AQZ97622.1 lysine transporter LysE [Comamonas kerstersii]KAB0585710.1 LysE family translocator [Comamonas kerstersii]KUF42445.1 lysine transporter LysE [Comamonas kerstersii]OOH88743.1 lysine transporter LysE [Comamonas kerstersii]
MPLQEFTALLVLATAMSFTPGPNTTLSTALAANHGLRRSLRFVLAVPVGWVLLLALCALGVGALVTGIPALRWAIKGVGIAYLLWLAFKLSRSGQLAQAQQAQLQVGFGQGVLLQFVNIKAWLLALTIVAGWVAGQSDVTTRMLVVLPVMALYALSSNLLYACIGAALRQWLAQGQRLLWFNRGMAALLVLTAIWMLQS